MATPADLLSQAATAIEAQTSATRRVSDYREDLDAVAVGATMYQLRGGPAAEDSRRSDGPRKVEALDLVLHHRLADPTDERAYTEGAMQTDVAAMIAPSFWTALAAAHEVTDPPSYDVERTLNVITVTIALRVSIVP